MFGNFDSFLSQSMRSDLDFFEVLIRGSKSVVRTKSMFGLTARAPGYCGLILKRLSVRVRFPIEVLFQLARRLYYHPS